ncbi:MAG: hypothetical protein EOS58_25510 [Mesorhizobium sp.]|nr:MAG: hypothetical protein EOS58_25510 [Mesorhizobium sp.]
MVRIRNSACMLLVSISTQSSAQTITYERMLSGASYGSIETFTVDDKDGEALRRRGFHVTHSDSGRNIVSKLTDPAYIDCWNGIGTPIVLSAATFATQLENPVAGVVGLGGAVLETRDRMVSCEDAWTSKVHEAEQDSKFDIFDARIGSLDGAISGAIGDILNLQDRTHDLNLLITTESGERKIEIKDIKKSLADLSDDVKSKIDNIAKDVKSSQADFQKYLTDAAKAAAATQRLADKQAALEGSVQIASLIGHLAFAHDPVASAKLDQGLSAVQTIGKSIIGLGKPGLETGAKILLSANIASGAFALVGLLGGGGGETAMLAQQIGAVRQDISSLRAEMHERFDRIEQILTSLAKDLDARLDKIDGKVEKILSTTKQLNDSVAKLIGIDISSFHFLVQEKYEESFRECDRAISRVTFKAAQIQTDCLNKYVTYASKVSRLAIASPASRFDPTIAIKKSAYAAFALPEEQRVGYLSIVLNEASKNGLLDSEGIKAPDTDGVPDPSVWADGVDNFSAFLGNIESFADIKANHLTFYSVLADYKRDIESLLIPTGQAAIDDIAKIRRAGSEFAVGLYRQDVSDLSKAVAENTLKYLYKRDLKITDVLRVLAVELRAPHDSGAFRSDGSTNYAVKFHDYEYFTVSKGPESGRQWKPKRHASFIDVNSATLMCQYCESATVDSFNQWFISNSAAVPLVQDMALDSIEAYKSDLHEINAPYLKGTVLADFTPEAKGYIDDAVRAAALSPEVLKACEEVSHSHTIVEMYARLMRGSYGVLDSAWNQALDELPMVTVEGCTEFVSSFAGDPMSSVSLTLTDYLQTTITGLGSSAADKFVSAYRVGEHEGHVDSVQARLQGLRDLVRQIHGLRN